MSRISITEASRTFNVAKNTIRRRVKVGDLTAYSQVHGRKVRSYFDVTDLVRVFGEPEVHQDKGSAAEDDLRSEVQDLEQQLALLVAEKAVWNEKEGRLQDQIHGLQTQIGLLERHLEDFRKVLAPQLESPRTFMERVKGVFHNAKTPN